MACCPSRSSFAYVWALIETDPSRRQMLLISSDLPDFICDHERITRLVMPWCVHISHERLWTTACNMIDVRNLGRYHTITVYDLVAKKQTIDTVEGVSVRQSQTFIDSRNISNCSTCKYQLSTVSCHTPPSLRWATICDDWFGWVHLQASCSRECSAAIQLWLYLSRSSHHSMQCAVAWTTVAATRSYLHFCFESRIRTGLTFCIVFTLSHLRSTSLSWGNLARLVWSCNKQRWYSFCWSRKIKHLSAEEPCPRPILMITCYPASHTTWDIISIWMI